MRSVVGAFCPGCLRNPLDFLFDGRDFAERPADPFGVAAAGAVLLLETVAGWALVLAVVTDAFFAGAFDAAFAWPKLPGTPSPAMAAVSRIKSAGRRFFIKSRLPLTSHFVTLVSVFCWHYARQKHRKNAIRILPAQHLENYVLAGFQFGDSGFVVCHR